MKLFIRSYLPILSLIFHMCVWQFYQNAEQNYFDTYHTNTARFVGIRFLTVFLTNVIYRPQDSSQPNSQFRSLLVQRLWRLCIKNSNTFHLILILHQICIDEKATYARTFNFQFDALWTVDSDSGEKNSSFVSL